MPGSIVLQVELESDGPVGPNPDGPNFWPNPLLDQFWTPPLAAHRALRWLRGGGLSPAPSSLPIEQKIFRSGQVNLGALSKLRLFCSHFGLFYMMFATSLLLHNRKGSWRRGKQKTAVTRWIYMVDHPPCNDPSCSRLPAGCTSRLSARAALHILCGSGSIASSFILF